ncbi:hypothetical protein KTH46_09565 [Acinetobacter bereziniae]|uniref:hypothetical protein n=1 Tax=Acinetobacter bereziniae TaxID=106648 RepID=UPI0021CEF21E|nr:hypothetical protein [Acinetobacter bereziniae]MCU4315268.1 hypothetical protein [Acinetobacter bereziniae]
MKTFASMHTCTQNNVKEHTPIYDLQAYYLRQRSIKRKQLLKNLRDTAVFFITVVLIFSILFWEA